MNDQYRFPLENFMSAQKFESIKNFSKGLETPCLILDLDIVRQKYQELRSHLSFAKIYYAVKANPDDAVVSLLAELGSNFDVATRYELDQLLRLGISPDRMSFGNTIKKEKDIAYFYEKGIRLFVTDSLSDLDKISRAAPGSKVFFRLLTEGLGADWPLSRKFGSHPDLARQLIKDLRALRTRALRHFLPSRQPAARRRAVVFGPHHRIAAFQVGPRRCPRRPQDDQHGRRFSGQLCRADRLHRPVCRGYQALPRQLLQGRLARGDHHRTRALHGGRRRRHRLRDSQHREKNPCTTAIPGSSWTSASSAAS